VFLLLFHLINLQFLLHPIYRRRRFYIHASSINPLNLYNSNFWRSIHSIIPPSPKYSFKFYLKYYCLFSNNSRNFFYLTTVLVRRSSTKLYCFCNITNIYYNIIQTFYFSSSFPNLISIVSPSNSIYC
jgi:hypothetical protein